MTGISLVIILLIFALLYVLQLLFKDYVMINLAAITYLFAVSSGIYFSFDTYKGWPSKEKIEKGYLIYSVTFEPSGKDKGAIYYWAVPEEKDMSFVEEFLTYRFETIAPRSYYLPYSKKAAQQFAEANEKIKEGFVVEIGGDENSDQADGGKNGKKGDGKPTSSGEQEEYNVPHLEIIPPDQILKKGQ